MKVLGIETSCDETSVAVVEARPKGFHVVVHVVSSQMAHHSAYGGVVPEVAARMHLEQLQPILDSALGRDGVASVDYIAVTRGPGLITSLMVGVQVAKTLSYMLRKPLVGVNHLEGHVYATWLTEPELFLHAKKFFPALALIVSGGHTEIILMRGHGAYKLIGQTVDDAAGEAFDKVAKILELGYPGGPVISKLARKGNPHAVDFPRPMLTSDHYQMSFSGLKTAVLYYLERKKTVPKKTLPDIAASFQQAVVDVLSAKLERACVEYRPASLMLAGGVSANDALRKELTAIGCRQGVPVFMPALQYTGDNAAMIAAAGYFRRREATRDAWQSLSFDPQLPLAV
ncbi:MAG: tRNA (adenosine(37)-N6)-threonylcarbamoyltransferase complex transferase subunit TsaD [Candidatus Komeilibacteria bacterium RIFCSPLOWO2_01_FULL_53_11]|uniref:tRNA N6-adenosine threonylcarbamoyltransferase n=1 Tax=Candidatus Komeilibacteria bacterium RIFCSPLOWO2_01_FULL_53_11 TaxID=1798552 RepID=A0A1G2BVN0_9BACT|nr:MAG: tRNA (adenosine(37)-N6)-threonylcarbamoyltransferase complex transferase subunit TsaD [Candidatus Komeilibacteria bacterium RIFCSPLOWO2_01_FULL_53_11]